MVLKKKIAFLVALGLTPVVTHGSAPARETPGTEYFKTAGVMNVTHYLKLLPLKF